MQRCLLCTRCEIHRGGRVDFQTGGIGVWLCVCSTWSGDVCVSCFDNHTHTNIGPSAFSRPSIDAESPSANEQRHISSLPPRLVSTHDRSFSNALNPMVGKMVGVLEKPQI